MNMRILRALLRKEFKMMRSNPLVPKVIIGMPLMVMLVLPLVANLDVKRVAVAVVDDDHSRLSARVVADLDAPAEIDVVGMPQTPAEAMSMMERGEADVVLTLPRHFERSGGDGYDIQANGVNATKGFSGRSMSVRRLGRPSRSIMQARGGVWRLPLRRCSTYTTPRLIFATIWFRRLWW